MNLFYQYENNAGYPASCVPIVCDPRGADVVGHIAGAQHHVWGFADGAYDILELLGEFEYAEFERVCREEVIPNLRVGGFGAQIGVDICGISFIFSLSDIPSCE